MTLLAARALLALAAGPPQGALQDASVHIAVAGDTARVIARYRFSGPGDSVRLHAMRVPGQLVALDRRLEDPRLRLDSLAGLFRVAARGQRRAMTLDLRYEVRGRLSRIPLFVPELPSVPGQTRITIAVDGVDPQRAARFVVPRFIREGRLWRATPDHLPSVVVLVKSEGGLPVPALAQWTVMIIALGGTLAWLMTQLASRRAR